LQTARRRLLQNVLLIRQRTLADSAFSLVPP
jgi:hypothetical protein